MHSLRRLFVLHILVGSPCSPFIVFLAPAFCLPLSVLLTFFVLSSGLIIFIPVQGFLVSRPEYPVALPVHHTSLPLALSDVCPEVINSISHSVGWRSSVSSHTKSVVDWLQSVV